MSGSASLIAVRIRDAWRALCNAVCRRDLPADPEAEAYWNDPANRHWARHSSVYDDRKKGC